MVVVTGNNHIDLSKSKQYILSIRLCTDGFSFSIYDTATERILAYDQIDDLDENLSITANLRAAFRHSEILAATYQKVNIIVTGKRFALLPKVFYKKEDIDTLFYFNQPRQDNETILQSLSNVSSEIVFLFGIDKAAYRLILEYYPDAEFYSQFCLLNDCFGMTAQKGQDCNRLFLSFRSGGIDAFAYDERGDLLLLNSFAVNHLQDTIYFILYLWKLLEFDQEEDLLLFYGVVKEKEQLLDVLKNYIQQISFMVPETNLDFKALL